MQEWTFGLTQNAVYFLIPLVVGVILYQGNKKKQQILEALSQAASPKRLWLKLIATVMGIALIVLALMGPRQEVGTREITTEGISVYVLVDTSKSMLTQDVTPSRIEQAKSIMNHLMDGLHGDRIGIIPYASSAYVQMPLTDDYTLAKMFVDVIDTEMVSGGGTNVAEAIQLAKQSFDQMSQKKKVILVLSDGEEEKDLPEDILKEVQEEDLLIYTIGIGTLEGGLIPEYGTDGATISGYMKDDQGNPVMSKLSEGFLQKLATTSGGTYAHATISDDGSAQILNQIKQLETSEQTNRVMTDYRQYYQIFLGLGMLLILIGWFMPERSKEK